MATGDTPRTSQQGVAHVTPVVVVRPLASVYRAAGYVVPQSILDGVEPHSYAADTPTPPGQVRLVK